MFAGAAREAVFSQDVVARRVNDQFIPVALKAGLINNPPRGIEGELYAEIARSKPAPQGICIANSAGKALVWALSFDAEQELPKFLDYGLQRYAELPDARTPVATERFMKFPGHRLSDVADTQRTLAIPQGHADDDRCPALPRLEAGTLVGRVIGRPLDERGQPIAETLRQEEYMEARFEVPVDAQRQLAAALATAGEQSFLVPDAFARALVAQAYLGQLDVNPLGGRQTGGRIEQQTIEFQAQRVEGSAGDMVRVRLTGHSDVSGAPNSDGRRTDGRMWEHRVQLTWEGYAELRGERVESLWIVAEGEEQLRWGHRGLRLSGEPDVAHLMAGHPIDLDTRVRYGLQAEPCDEREVDSVRHAPASRLQHLRSAARHLQALGERTILQEVQREIQKLEQAQ